MKTQKKNYMHNPQWIPELKDEIIRVIIWVEFQLGQNIIEISTK